MGANLAQRPADVARLGNHRHPTLSLKQHSQHATAHQHMVIGKDHRHKRAVIAGALAHNPTA
jgi:hypothetical protein